MTNLIPLLIFFIFGIVSCSSGTNFSEKGISLPTDAYEVEEIQLEGESAQQITFKFDVSYPNTQVAEYYAEELGKEGWQKCSSKNGEKWERFIKEENGEEVAIDQYLQYLISHDKTKLLALALRYQNRSPTQEYEDSVQQVTLLLYELGNGVNFEQIASLLLITCE